MLKHTSFLKVGHHGSHNATPKSFVQSFVPADALAMVSTCPVAKWPRIPKQELLTALTEKGVQYARSDQPGESNTPFVTTADRYIEVRIPLA